MRVLRAKFEWNPYEQRGLRDSDLYLAQSCD
jgi:hypothetical protein